MPHFTSEGTEAQECMSTVVQSLGLEVNGLVFKSWLSLAMAYGKLLNHLCLHVLTCKVKIIAPPCAGCHKGHRTPSKHS